MILLKKEAMQRISIIGLGKLGASMMAGFASRGFDVIGVDVNQKAVEAINQGLPPIQETDLDLYLTKYRSRISATTQYTEAVLQTDISFVIVPTPSDERGAFSVEYVKQAFQSIGEALRQKETYHVVVLTSTVLPGSSRFALIPMLEEASGKKCGSDFGFCYSPEFIALGSVIRDFLNPDFYLVGEYDKRSGDYLEAVNQHTALNHSPSKRMSIENAEIAKIALNCFVTMKISFANLLGEICEQIPGGSVDVVTEAIGMDKRIGKHYLKGGLGFGGPCFPRDNAAFAFMSKQLGVDCCLPTTNDQYNRSLAKRLVKKITPLIPDSATIAVLGLAYKPLSHVIEESQGVLLTQELIQAGYSVCAYDPLAKAPVPMSQSLKACLNQADVVIVTTPDPLFIALKPSQFTHGTIVIDCWRCLSVDCKNAPHLQYIPLGQYLEQREADSTVAKISDSLEQVIASL